MKVAVTLSACAMMAFAGSALAVDIASQDFNGLSDAGGPSFDQFASGNTLTNANSSNAGGGGMDFSTVWTDTRALADGLGPVTTTSDTSDFIGVNSFGGSNSPDVAANGTPVASGTEHNYEFNDGDGNLALIFGAVDASGFTGVSVSFNYWINSTGFEGDDFFSATLSDGVGSVDIFNWGELEIEANQSADDGSANWGIMSIGSVETLGLDMSNLILTINADANSGSENIFVDNILISGIPTPGAVALMGVAGIAGLRRRR